jgi:hypothetical protein
LEPAAVSLIESAVATASAVIFVVSFGLRPSPLRFKCSWLAKFFKNPANHQKSGRKFTDNSLKPPATTFYFYCCVETLNNQWGYVKELFPHFFDCLTVFALF